MRYRDRVLERVSAEVAPAGVSGAAVSEAEDFAAGTGHTLISRDFVTMRVYHPENFEEPHETTDDVIPAQAGIQFYQILSGFPAERD